MDVRYVFTGSAVARLDPALEWYTRLLGREPDLRPHPGEAAWQLAAGASLFVRERAVVAAAGIVTLIVASLDDEVHRLRSAGLPVADPQPVGDAGRKAVIHDPDGNRIELVELS